MVIYLGSLVQLCCGEWGTLQANVTGMCGGACSVWTTLGLPQLTAACVFGSTLLRLQVALQGYCPNWALHFVYFPVLNCLGSDSWVLCKGTDSVGHVFCALPMSEQLRRPGALWAHCPMGHVLWAMRLNHLPDPGCLDSQVHCESTDSGVPCVSSGELSSGCDPPGRCQLFRILGKLG